VRSGRLALVGTAALTLAAAGTAARQETPPFRAATRVVAVYATVTDRDRRLVTSLGRDDFEVRDNGERVAVTSFSSAPAPISLAILLDSSGSMRESLPLVVTATDRLIDLLEPADLAILGAFGDRTAVMPRLTPDRDELRRFLHTRVRAGGETPLWNAMDLAMVYLKDAPTRRALLVFTDGFDTTTLDRGLAAVIKRADEENVMLYAIGCWGGPGSGESPPDSSLRKVTERTGGAYAELTWQKPDDLTPTFSRVSEELHRQYLLGFSPARLDGKTHDIDVRVKTPGLTVRARRTYTAR